MTALPGNLWHFLSDLGAEVEIIRNDASSVDGILDAAPQGIIISPGPGKPEDAGITIDLIRAARAELRCLASVLDIRRWPLPLAGASNVSIRLFMANYHWSRAAIQTPLHRHFLRLSRGISCHPLSLA